MNKSGLADLLQKKEESLFRAGRPVEPKTARRQRSSARMDELHESRSKVDRTGIPIRQTEKERKERSRT